MVYIYNVGKILFSFLKPLKTEVPLVCTEGHSYGNQLSKKHVDYC